MITFVFTIMLVSGVVFIISVLLMTPKWGLWFGVGGMATSNEYSSKKSVESTLKRSALFSIILFTISAIVYPYMAKKQLANPNNQQLSNKTLQDAMKNGKIDIKWVDSNWKKVNVNVTPTDWTKTTDTSNSK